MRKINSFFNTFSFVFHIISFIGLFYIGCSLFVTNKNVSETQHLVVLEIEKFNNDLKSLKEVADKNSESLSFLDSAVKASDKLRARVEKVKTVIKEDIDRQRYKSNLSVGEIYTVASAIVRYSERYGVPMSLIVAVIRQESGFNSRAVSKAGAQGLMQVMPETAKECAIELNKKEYEYSTFDLSDNVQIGTFYLSKMLYLFKKDVASAVQSYNAGPVFVRKFQSQEEGFTSLPQETIKYHENVMQYYSFYQEKGL